MPIQVLDNGRVFILSTARTSYVIYLNQVGHPLNAYWGPLVSRAEDFADAGFSMEPLALPPQQLWPEEYSAFGGLRYKETACKVTFADGTRDLRWKPAEYTTNQESDTLCLVLRDTHYALEIQLYYRLHAELDILERWCRVCNGSTPALLERCCSAQFSLPGTGYQSLNFTGRWAGEFQRQEAGLVCGKQVYESLCGLTGHQCAPVFAVHQGADENQGGVWFGALGYSGNFKIVLENVCGHSLSILAGIGDSDFSWPLTAGECFETPHVYAGYANGLNEMSYILHRFARKALLPRPLAEKPLPVLYNSWYATEFELSEASQCALAEKAAALGVELFVMDDGWFAGRRDSTAGLGDWMPDPQKFPRGLTPLRRRIQQLGMCFGLWIEPEMVNPDSRLYAAHPNWILRYPTREPLVWRSQYILDLSLTAVRKHLFSTLNALVRENEISYLKWDMNRYAAEVGSCGCPPGEWKTLWHKQAMGVYDLAQQLRTAHPKLELEACASGGGRVDFGALQYFDEFWPSDNTDPLDRLSIQRHYSLFYPAKCMRAWVTSDGPFNGRIVPLSFAAHTAMCGVLGIGLDLNRESPERLQELTEYVRQYKRIREAVQLGRLYRLEDCWQGPLEAMEYVLENRAVLFVFLHRGQYGRRFYRCRLQGLDRAALYCFHTDSEDTVKSGAYLMQHGLILNLHGDWSSRIVEFVQVPSDTPGG